jgi:hypothetical protein
MMQAQFMPHSHAQSQVRFGQRYSVHNALIISSNKGLLPSLLPLRPLTLFLSHKTNGSQDRNPPSCWSSLRNKWTCLKNPSQKSQSHSRKAGEFRRQYGSGFKNTLVHRRPEQEPSVTGLCARCFQHEPCYTASPVLLLLLSFGALVYARGRVAPQSDTVNQDSTPCAVFDAFYKGCKGGRTSPQHQFGVPP